MTDSRVLRVLYVLPIVAVCGAGLVATTSVGAAAQAKPTPAAAQVRSKLTITVPNEDAILTIDGRSVPGNGFTRTYETPPLTPGTSYGYTIIIEWAPNNYTTLTRSKIVSFKAGEPVAVDLTNAEPTDRVKVRFVPTPNDIAAEMVKLAGVGANDVVFEPGCGDGRITIAAVKAGARRGVCIDIDPNLVEQARARVKDEGLADRIEVRLGDALDIADLPSATVVLLYMGDHFNLMLRPSLWKQLRVGARVVSQRFRMGDWEPEKTIWVDSDEGGQYELHRWVVTADVKKR